MDNENKGIINAGPSKKDKLLEEKEALQKELREYSGVSPRQTRYKEVRLELINKQIEELDKPKEGNSTDKDSQNEFLMKMMAKNQGMAA